MSESQNNLKIPRVSLLRFLFLLLSKSHYSSHLPLLLSHYTFHQWTLPPHLLPHLTLNFDLFTLILTCEIYHLLHLLLHHLLLLLLLLFFPLLPPFNELFKLIIGTLIPLLEFLLVQPCNQFLNLVDFVT